jgi:hypothetical protein
MHSADDHPGHQRPFEADDRCGNSLKKLNWIKKLKWIKWIKRLN